MSHELHQLADPDRSRGQGPTQGPRRRIHLPPLPEAGLRRPGRGAHLSRRRPGEAAPLPAGEPAGPRRRPRAHPQLRAERAAGGGQGFAPGGQGWRSGSHRRPTAHRFARAAGSRGMGGVGDGHLAPRATGCWRSHRHLERPGVRLPRPGRGERRLRDLRPSGRGPRGPDVCFPRRQGLSS